MKTLERRTFLSRAAGRSASAEYFTVKPEAFRIKPGEQWHIYRKPGSDDVLRFSAQELAKYIKKISGIDVGITDSGALNSRYALVLSRGETVVGGLAQFVAGAESLAQDGFLVRSDADSLLVAAPNGRGVLYGVYALLEQAGCRFFAPGDDGEIVPSYPHMPIPLLDLREEPTFVWREWKEDMSYVARTDNPDHKKRHEAFFMNLWDWMGKNRINLSMNRDYPKGQGASALRGIRHCTGGHVIPELMPRELFAEHPDYFRMDQRGERVPNGNFCPSNAQALAVVAENAAQYIRRNSWAVNIEVIGADVWDGSWCFCPSCSTLSVQDQYIIACNAITEAIRKEGVDVQIDAMAYHDTLEPDLKVKPHPDLRLMWAPRERSFGHAHNDPRSDLNQYFCECLEQWAAIFGAEKIDLFEYWHDNILFRTFPIAIPHNVARDIRYYNDLGIYNHCVTCHLGDYAFQAEPLNCYVFTKMLYNRDFDVDDLITDYCRHTYGPAAGIMQEWHNEFEEAIRYCATFGDIQRPPAECSPRVEKLMSEISRSLKRLNDINPLVKSALRKTNNPREYRRIATQSWINDFAILMVSGLLNQIKGEYHSARIQEMVWGRASRGGDPHRGLAGRYIQAIGFYKNAVSFYEEAVTFIENLPPEEHSVWCDTSLPSHNRRVCDEMRAKITEFEKYIQG